MTETEVVAVASLVGAAIGGVISIAGVLLDRSRRKAADKVRILADQVAAYYDVVTLYCSEINRLQPDRNPITILKEMRDRVEEADGAVRPDMTRKMAEKIKRRYELPW
jgi:hypothetical protein